MRKASKSRARTFFAPWLATLLVALSLVVLSGSTASAVDDVYICHATGNTQNLSSVEDVKGFVVNSPAETGDVSGHVGTGHQDGWDIIPPVPGLPEGQNWTAYGQEVYNSGCNVPVKDAAASVGITPPTCDSGAVLVLNTPTFATWGPVTGTSTGPGSYSVTATSDPGHRFPDGSTTKSFSGTLAGPLDPDTSELCGPDEIELPAEPSVIDPCGVGNATWNVPQDSDVFEWDVVDGDLVVTIVAEDTVFEGTDDTTYNFGKAPETNTDPCIEEIEVPAEPSVTDPCGVGNATWNVPQDSDVFEWDVVDGDLVVTIVADNTVFEGYGDTTYNFGKAPETNLEACEVDPEELEVPAEPEVSDPCGAGNAEWIVPDDNETFDWELVDGELVVSILTENTVFEGTDDTTYNFGEAVETNLEECEVLGEQLEIPAQPAVKDPCGADNARWIVPADTGKLDWTLTGGVLSVEITVPDTVFEGTDDTTYSFGKAVETNTDACEVKGDQGDQTMTVEVKGEQAAVPTAVDAGLPGLAENHQQDTARNPLWLLAVGGGLGLMGIAGSRRRRTATR